MKKFFYLSLVLAGLFATSCSDDDPPFADNTVNFSATELGISETESSKSFTVNIDRAESTDITVNINLTATGVVYGTDFATTPAASGNTITATIKAGNTSTSVEVKKTAALLDGDESINFEIASATGGLVLGDKKALKLTFGAIVSTGSTMTLQGGEGGPSAVNSVFVDLSGNEQTSVARNTWSLGFYCGDSFAVKLNNTTGSSAKKVDLQLTDVISAADSTAHDISLAFARISGASFDLVDDVKGDLAKNVIKENNVYLVRLGATAAKESALYKVKVSKTDKGYSLQYAASGSATVITKEIEKSSDYNFVHFSFGSNALKEVEPIKAKWDIKWSYQTYTTGKQPYNYSDFVSINYLAGVTAAEVLGDTKAYAAFNKNSLTDVNFVSDVDAIGGNWRATTGTPLGIKADRFYLVKDASGNVYKLRFLKMGVGADGGVRGYPEIEYALVK